MYKCTRVSFHIEFAFARKQLSFWNVVLVRRKRIKRVPLCITTTNKSFLKKLFPLAHTSFCLFCILYSVYHFFLGNRNTVIWAHRSYCLRCYIVSSYRFLYECCPHLAKIPLLFQFFYGFA